MSVKMDDILEFWCGLLTDTNAKPAERLKASEDLARYLENTSQRMEMPKKIVILYGTPPETEND